LASGHARLRILYWFGVDHHPVVDPEYRPHYKIFQIARIPRMALTSSCGIAELGEADVVVLLPKVIVAGVTVMVDILGAVTPA